jgi:UDP-N-acetylglucosamine transferase subunit ALG13
MTCLAHGKRPIVVPRLSRYGETSDDHQLAFARRLAEAGLVTLVEEPERLPEALAAANGASAGAFDGSGGLVRELREYLTAAVAAG